MLVFIDESGDPGFKVPQGSSPIFVAAMVMFTTPADALTTERVIRATMSRLRVKPEFKFNKSSNEVRDGFFQAVRNCPFMVRAIVVRKEVIYSPHLKTNKEDFYRFFVRQMMQHDNGRLEQATVVIDGSGDRSFRAMLKSSLRRHLGARLKDVRFSNSRSDVLVQLADMCTGAIARSYRADRPDRDRWRLMLAPRINDVWDFR
jgi:hypothetical protein